MRGDRPRRLPRNVTTIPDDIIDAVVTDAPYHLPDYAQSIRHAEDPEEGANSTDWARGLCDEEWDGGDIRVPSLYVGRTSALTTIDPALLIGIDPLTCFLPTLSR